MTRKGGALANADQRVADDGRSLDFHGVRRLTLIGLLAVCLAGCASDATEPPTLSTWQQNLEQYVWDHANGDPNVLADMSWDDVHNGFAVIGDPLPERSTDLVGLLLAHRILHGKPYFLFLLGTIRRQNLEDLRPVALNVEGGEFHWSLGPENDRSLSLYRVWSEADRERSGPRDPPAPAFPRPRETFDVTVSGGVFRMRHEESGAQWELQPNALPTSRPNEMQPRSTPEAQRPQRDGDGSD